jgi:hypothetical protein
MLTTAGTPTTAGMPETLETPVAEGMPIGVRKATTAETNTKLGVRNASGSINICHTILNSKSRGSRNIMRGIITSPGMLATAGMFAAVGK